MPKASTPKIVFKANRHKYSLEDRAELEAFIIREGWKMMKNPQIRDNPETRNTLFHLLVNNTAEALEAFLKQTGARYTPKTVDEYRTHCEGVTLILNQIDNIPRRKRAQFVRVEVCRALKFLAIQYSVLRLINLE